MGLRDSDTIVDQVAELQLQLQELKEKQFTSQDSGLLFREASTSLNYTFSRGSADYVYLSLDLDIKSDSENLILPVLEWSISGGTLTKSDSRSFQIASGSDIYYGELQLSQTYKTNTGYHATWIMELFGEATFTTTLRFTPTVKSTKPCTLSASISRTEFKYD